MLLLRAGLVAEQRQEPRRAGITFVRAAIAQDHASGRHEPRPGRQRRRQSWAAWPVSPAVEDHGSLLVLEAKSELLHVGDRTREANACSPLADRRAVERHGMAPGKEEGEADEAGAGDGEEAGEQSQVVYVLIDRFDIVRGHVDDLRLSIEAPILARRELRNIEEEVDEVCAAMAAAYRDITN